MIRITDMYFYTTFIQKSIDTFSKYYEIRYFYYSIYFNSFLNAIREINRKENIIKERQQSTNENILLKTWYQNVEREFDTKLRSDNFVNLLDKYVNSSLDLFNNIYNNASINSQLIYHDFFDFYLKYFYSPFISISKELKLADHKIIFQKDPTKLLHYIDNNTHQQTKGSENYNNNNILLIIYAPINRFHILDLNPSKSVVRTLLNNGIDVYLLDWGYPDKRDNDLTLKDYIDYIDNAVDAIIQDRSFTSSSSSPIKISILGYCWGGLNSIIYTAVANNQKNIDKLILMATPVDFSKDNTTVSMWSKTIDTDKIIETFGHFDGYLLDFVFNMRNPVANFAKYFTLWKNLDNKDFINTFFDVEKWLHDTPPIPGELYKKIVNDCYKNNLLITGNMKLVEEDGKLLAKEEKEEDDNNNNKININKITIPVLSIIAEKDDLVSPISSLVINDYISSKEKEVLKHPGGHVSLCISDTAHKELWPKVANWIKSKIS
jgi:polyhydroxyalkanoate synthase subunit PhaC